MNRTILGLSASAVSPPQAELESCDKQFDSDSFVKQDKTEPHSCVKFTDINAESCVKQIKKDPLSCVKFADISAESCVKQFDSD